MAKERGWWKITFTVEPNEADLEHIGKMIQEGCIEGEICEDEDEPEEKPNCYECAHRGLVSGDAHSKCNNKDANVEGMPYGIQSGWFMWPSNFDPTWLVSCDGFKQKEKK